MFDILINVMTVTRKNSIKNRERNDWKKLFSKYLVIFFNFFLPWLYNIYT